MIGKLFGLLVVLAGIAAVCLVASVVDGFVAMHVWNWFMVPIGVPAVRLVHAIGIGLVVCVLTNHLQPRTLKNLGETFSAIFIGPFVVLGIAWVVHCFM